MSPIEAYILIKAYAQVNNMTIEEACKTLEKVYIQVPNGPVVMEKYAAAIRKNTNGMA
jgi:hypothetical protein